MGISELPLEQGHFNLSQWSPNGVPMESQWGPNGVRPNAGTLIISYYSSPKGEYQLLCSINLYIFNSFAKLVQLVCVVTPSYINGDATTISVNTTTISYYKY